MSQVINFSSHPLVKRYRQLMEEFTKADKLETEELKKLISEFQAYHKKLNSGQIEQAIIILKHMLGELEALMRLTKEVENDLEGAAEIKRKAA